MTYTTRISTSLALLFALLVASSTGVAKPVDKARQAFIAAEKAYRAERYDEALAGFQAALALARRPSIILNIAQCYRYIGDAEAALSHYELYVNEWEEFRPGTPPPYANEVAIHIQQLRRKIDSDNPEATKNIKRTQAARDPQPATLFLLGAPVGASVFVDGEYVAHAGPKPTRLEVHPGLRHIVVQAEGYVHWKTTIDLLPGQTLRQITTPQKKPEQRGSTKPWMIAGLSTAALAVGAEIFAIVSTVKANDSFSGTPEFDRYAGMAVGGHVTAGLSVVASAVCWWMYLRLLD